MELFSVIPFVQDNDFQLFQGDALEVLRQLPDESVQMCVTSPPYWGLRDYSVEGQLGLEETPDLYISRLVDVFREVRRVLRRDGTLWCNMGDSFLPGKQLAGVPWRLAFALQDDGWILRSDIIWSKPNPMPESVTDRPTKSHEYLFLLTRSSRYFFDQEAVREEAEFGRREWTSIDGNMASVGGGRGHATVRDFRKPPQDSTLDGSTGESPRGPDGRRKTTVQGGDGSIQHRDGERWPNGGRNLRSVWEIPTEPYPQAHFATYPQALVERCVKAGTSEHGCCPVCGAPWKREVERELHPVQRTFTSRAPNDGFVKKPDGHIPATQSVTTLGWRPGCACVEIVDRGDEDPEIIPTPTPISCVVLDPFLGSGTTALVARRLGRKTVGIELNEDYCQMAARRLQQQSLFAQEAS